MSPGRPWTVAPADEGRHRSGDEALWGESYYMDFVADDGSIGGYVRLGLYPNLGVSWWTTSLVMPGRPSVVSMAYDLGVPAPPGLEADGPTARVALEVADPLRSLAVRAGADARVIDQPADAYRAGSGRPADLAVDCTWTTDGEPYHYVVTTRYEIPCRVDGEVRVGDRVIGVRGHGQRDHSWGVRDWWAFGWCWMAFATEDGTRVHAADIRIPGSPVAFGYLQSPGAPLTPLGSLTVSEDRDAEGFPGAAEVHLGPGGLSWSVEPLGFGPALLTAPDGRVSRFPRAMARFVAPDGRSGLGWIEWNQPQ